MLDVCDSQPDGLTQPAVARLLGCSPQNVQLIEKRGLAKLRQR